MESQLVAARQRAGEGGWKLPTHIPRGQAAKMSIRQVKLSRGWLTWGCLDRVPHTLPTYLQINHGFKNIKQNIQPWGLCVCMPEAFSFSSLLRVTNQVSARENSQCFVSDQGVVAKQKGGVSKSLDMQEYTDVFGVSINHFWLTLAPLGHFWPFFWPLLATFWQILVNFGQRWPFCQLLGGPCCNLAQRLTVLTHVTLK